MLDRRRAGDDGKLLAFNARRRGVHDLFRSPGSEKLRAQGGGAFGSGSRGACHRARIRATSWLGPGRRRSGTPRAIFPLLMLRGLQPKAGSHVLRGTAQSEGLIMSYSGRVNTGGAWRSDGGFRRMRSIHAAARIVSRRADAAVFRVPDRPGVLSIPVILAWCSLPCSAS